MTDHQASCSCGQSTLVAREDPIRAPMCHCDACQRRTGRTDGAQRLDLPVLATDGEPPQVRPWVLYLLECAGERLYAGITNDLQARFTTHCAGRGARFTKAFPPVRIVAASLLPSRSEALKAEYALKQQPRAAKLAFLAACGTPVSLEADAAP
jgi:putative endonuclease